MKTYTPLTYRVTGQEEGWSLRAVLREKMHISRRLLIRLKQAEDGIMLNGEQAWVNQKVSAGDLIELRMEEEQSETIVPQYFPLDVLYEDEYLLALHKPPGRLVHPTLGHSDGTIANAVMYYWQEQEKRHRFRAVHRLDRDTSGVLVIAKNPYVHQQIAKQMEQGLVQKHYIAYVRGKLSPGAGTICGAIGRSPDNPHVRTVIAGGSYAITHYKVLEEFAGRYSKVWLHLVTGRTHQLRVHMQYAGCPLIADELYGGALSEAETRDWIPRQALHAASLRFMHPMNQQPLHLTAPLPADLLELEQRLRGLNK